MVFAKNDMATEREEGLQEGLQKGEINAYIKLVRDDLLAPDIAAQRSNMNIDAFKNLL